MAQLTEEELARLYPTPKTFDEQQAERAVIDELRRPKFPALQMSLWLAASVPVMLVVYHANSYLVSALNEFSSTGEVLAGVSFGLLTLILGVLLLYYFYTQFDALVSKTISATPVLYRLLAGMFFATGASFTALGQLERSDTGVAVATTLVAFALSFAVISYVLKRQ